MVQVTVAEVEVILVTVQQLDINGAIVSVVIRAVVVVVAVVAGSAGIAGVVVAEEEMLKRLHYKGEPYFMASAVNGPGVFETLKAVVKQVLLKLKGNETH